MEPALTNIGIVLPEDGYLAGVREITRRHGVLLVMDETHTLCAGPGGCTRAWGLEPDFVVVGKPIGGGVPSAAYGMSSEIADQLSGPMLGHEIDVAGVGGTLTANALALAAIRATLSSSLREEDFAVAIPLAERFTEGVTEVINRHELPWHVQRLGCRAEYWFCPPPRDGAVPQHGVVQPPSHHRRRRPPYRGLRRGSRRSGPLPLKPVRLHFCDGSAGSDLHFCDGSAVVLGYAEPSQKCSWEALSRRRRAPRERHQ